MAKFKAPSGCDGVSVGGEWFGSENGIVTVPDSGDYSPLVSLGFTALTADETDAVDKAAVDKAAADKAAADAAAKSKVVTK